MKRIVIFLILLSVEFCLAKESNYQRYATFDIDSTIIRLVDKAIFLTTTEKSDTVVDTIPGKDIIGPAGRTIELKESEKSIYILFNDGTNFKISELNGKDTMRIALKEMELLPYIVETNSSIKVERISQLPQKIENIRKKQYKVPYPPKYAPSYELIRNDPIPIVSIKADLLLNPLWNEIDRSISNKLRKFNPSIGIEWGPQFRESPTWNGSIVGMRSRYLSKPRLNGVDKDSNLNIFEIYLGYYFKMIYAREQFVYLIPNLGMHSDWSSTGGIKKTKLDAINFKIGFMIIKNIKRNNSWPYLDFNYYRTSNWDKTAYSIFFVSAGYFCNIFR